MGEDGGQQTPGDDESFLALRAGDVGLVVVSESIGVFNHQGEVDDQAVIESSRRWWDYWREYWRRRDSADSMSKDYACEVTIPIKEYV